jgi:hypothetical protein
MFNILNHQENANQNYTEILTPSQWQSSRKQTANIGKDVGIGG